MITRLTKLSFRLIVGLALSLGLVACGGGGGGGGGGGFLPEDDTETWVLTLTLLDADGNPTDTVTSTSPATLSARVTRNRASGTPVTGEVVSVTTTLGLLDPDTGSALTNEDGEARLRLLGDGTRGAGTLTASVDGPSGTVTETINFQAARADLRLGVFEDGTFVEGVIGIEPESALVWQGTAELAVAVVDENNQRAEAETEIRFDSECLITGRATLDPPSPVTTTTGQIIASYTGSRCEGEDVITASIPGGSGQAVVSVTFAPPSANSLQFLSAEPDTIVLQGTGGGGAGRQESSTVQFRVIDANNNPIPGATVRFQLTTETGGARLSRQSAVSDADGVVSVVVSSGSIPTPVRVIASIETNESPSRTVSTVSDILTITTGLPDQNSISLSVEGGFVVEGGFTTDGVERQLTVRMADKFNNPVPDGTAAVFTTEYGTIDPSCVTGIRNGERLTNQTPRTGECTVLWTSGEPRTPTLESGSIRRIDNPQGYDCPSHNGSTGPCPDDLGEVRGGRSTVLVTAIGEESFIDRNGNGIMDENERELFDNLTEAFIDHNEDGVFNPASSTCQSGSESLACVSGNEETFVDYNSNGRFDSNNNPAVYNGLLCPPEGDGVWCSRTLLNVRDQAVLILSADNNWDILLVRSGAVVSGTREGTVQQVYISDVFNNRPPANSSISISTTGGCELVSASPVIVPISAAYGAFGFDLETAGDGESGQVTITLQPGEGGAEYSETFDCVSFADPDPEGDGGLTTSPG